MSVHSLKIKTLSRGNKAGSSRLKKVLIGFSIATVAVVALGVYQRPKSPVAKKAVALVARDGASVRPQMHETQIAELMMKRRTQLENQRTLGGAKHSDESLALASENDRPLGVQMDQENSAERIYEDLYGEKTGYAEGSPEEKINARLANRKWLNEMERAERLNFVKNFIRQAYDRGYEVTLDQNLVVIGVKKISGSKVVNIDQVLDRIAKQGH